jgi:glyoxylase-like metal-dependent hydrolase (beta-lactamase superfamily II)
MIRVEPHGDVTFLRMARRWLGRPLYWTGAYVVDGLLIDAGPPALARELAGVLADVPLVGLVATHHHEDHTGGAGFLAERRGLVPRVHPAGVPILAEGIRAELYRRVAWGRPRPVTAEPLASHVESRRLRFEVVPTPGHSVDHVCLLEPERGWLFTGDLFLAERLRYLRNDEDLAALIDSLRRVTRLPVKHVFCAHRGPVRGGAAALLRKAEVLEELRERVLDLLRSGLAESEIARRVVGREGVLTWISRGAFAARNFVRAVARGASV